MKLNLTLISFWPNPYSKSYLLLAINFEIRQILLQLSKNTTQNCENIVKTWGGFLKLKSTLFLYSLVYFDSIY